MPQASKFMHFWSAVHKHLIASNHIKILILPVLLLMIVSNWAEMKIPSAVKDTVRAFAVREPNAFSSAMSHFILFSILHYVLAWLYSTIFFVGLFPIKAILLRQHIEACLEASSTKHNSIGTGRIASMAQRQAGAMTKLLELFVMDVGYSIVFFILCLRSIYIELNPACFYVFILLFVVLCLLLMFFLSILCAKKECVTVCEGTITNKLIDIIKNYSIIKAFNNERLELESYSKMLDSYVHSGVLYSAYSQAFSFVYRIVLFFVYVLIYIGCYTRTLSFGRSVEKIILFQQFFALFKKRITKIKEISLKFGEYYAIISVANTHVADSHQDNRPEVAMHSPAVVEFEDTRILLGDAVLFEGFTIRIAKGEKIAVTGRNGSGKSTIIKTLLGFRGYEGSISIDGVQISSINENALRAMISYVPQEPHLLDATVWENLTYGARNLSEDEVVKVCMRCGTHSFFMGLSNGYSTRVGEGGRYLSGGQCQLLNFMRAVMKDAPIFVLDEPTSNLDYTASRELIDLVFSVLRDKTVILTTHDPSLLSHFDRIVNIKDGRVDVYDSAEEFEAVCKGKPSL